MAEIIMLVNSTLDANMKLMSRVVLSLCAQVRTRDQMLPMHVLHVAGHVPGLPGLFMAGVFSGSLSTISSGLNSLAAIALRDFLPRERLAKLTSLQQVRY